MSRNYRNNDLGKTLKDYAVPLVGLFLIIILLYNVFSGDDNLNNKEDSTNIEINSDFNGVQVLKDTEDTKAYITYKNEKKVEIEDKINLGKGEKIDVENGSVSIIESLKIKSKLSKAGEFEYKEDGSYLLQSGNLWIESISDLLIYAKYANIELKAGNIVNISQNAIETTVYAISGDIKVTTLYGIDINLKSGNKIIIKAKETNSGDFDVNANTKKIDDYFKMSSWFSDNGGNIIISSNEHSTNSGSVKLEKINTIIEFDNLVDESYVKDSNLKITGRFDSLKVGKITLNNKNVELNNELGTFTISFELIGKINDIVVKVFDKNQNILSKKVFTIYNSNTKNVLNNNYKVNSNIENYEIDATKFIIYEPTKTGKLTTTSSQITLRGKVLDKNIKAVLVNNYKLKSFNGTTWRYHAFVEQGTLKPGANLYEIKYLDKDGKVVYKEYYNIYKEIKTTSNISKKISDEANIKTDS